MTDFVQNTSGAAGYGQYQGGRGGQRHLPGNPAQQDQPVQRGSDRRERGGQAHLLHGDIQEEHWEYQVRETLPKTVVNMCCFVRGKVVWNNSNIVDIADDMTRHRHEYIIGAKIDKQSSVN